MIRLAPTSRVTIRGQAYRDPVPSDEGYTLTAEKTGKSVQFTHDALESIKNARKLRYDQKFYEPVAAKARAHAHSYGSRSDEKKKRHELRVAWRIAFCQKFHEREDQGQTSRSKPAMADAIPQIQTELVMAAQESVRAGSKVTVCAQPSIRALQRWLKVYAKSGALGLIPAYHKCGCRVPRLSIEITTVMNRFLAEYADERYPTIVAAYTAMDDEFNRINAERSAQGFPALQIPCLATFSSRLKDENQFRQYAQRKGKAKAIAKFYGARGGVKVSQLLERAEIDQLHIDIFSFVTDRRIFDLLSPEDRKHVERVRYWVTAIIDCASRYNLATIVSRTETAAAALQALKLSMTDKNDIAVACGAVTPWSGHGLICELVADNGAAFIDDGFRHTCSLLGITLTHTPTGRPQLRATIERYFRTLTWESVAHFAGRSFSSVAEKGNYPAKERTSLTRDELAKILVRAVVDIYHNSHHRGLHKETPLHTWNRIQDEFVVPPEPDRLLMLVAFGQVFERKTGINGVEFHGLWYHCRELQEHRMKRGDALIGIRVDIENLASIAVKIGNGWVCVPAIDVEAASTSLCQLKAETAYLNKLFYDANVVGRAAARKARMDFREVHLDALKKAEIGPTILDEDELFQAETDVLLGFRIAEDDADIPQFDINSDRFATGGAVSTDPSAADFDLSAETDRSPAASPSGAKAPKPSRQKSSKKPNGKFGGWTIKE